MNRYHVKNLNFKIKKSKKIIINPIKVQAIDYKKKKLKLIAINEVSLFRQSRQTSSIQVMENNKMIIKKLIGDGILVSTPAGSTAYNFSVNGPILTLMSGKLAVTPISPFRPRKWKGRVVSNKSFIKIKNLDPKKRPLALVADNIEKRNIKSLEIKNYKKIKIILLYDKSTNLNNKIKLEQKRKNT
jgi:NAD+ kinase